MRSLRILGLYILAVFVGGALLAPGLYFLAQWGKSVLPALAPLADNPFHRFVNRSLLILGLIGLWPFFKYAGLNSFDSLGLRRGHGSGALWTRGILVGLASLALAALIILWSGSRAWNSNRTEMGILQHLLSFAGAAIIVAVIEEILFRGAIYGGLRKSMRWPAALAISSGLYALVHFFQRPAPPETVTWATGLATLGQMMRGFVDPATLWPGFVNLALAGAMLGLAYEKSKTIYFSIGLHAGWIFWLKSFAYLTRDLKADAALFWGTAKLTDGYASTLVLMLALLALLRWPWLLEAPKPSVPPP